MEIFLLIVSVLLNIVLIFICTNLYKKNVQYEQIIVYINNKVITAVENMRRLDRIGAFEADDEVGTTFKGLLEIINELRGLIDVEKEKEE